MSKQFEVTWKMYGAATVAADSMEEAIEFARHELIHWNGAGINVVDLIVDGTDVDS